MIKIDYLYLFQFIRNIRFANLVDPPDYFCNYKCLMLNDDRQAIEYHSEAYVWAAPNAIDQNGEKFHEKLEWKQRSNLRSQTNKRSNKNMLWLASLCPIEKIEFNGGNKNRISKTQYRQSSTIQAISM